MLTKKKRTIRKLRQMLRLAYGWVSSREIGRVLGLHAAQFRRTSDAWPMPG